MIVDTNVLLRALDGAATAYGQVARRRIEAARSAGDAFMVLAVTLLEAVYVLESERAGYGWDRDGIARAVMAVVDEPAFDVEHADAFRHAAESYRARSVDIHDCLLSAVAHERGTRELSFDDDPRTLGTGEQS